MFIKPHRKEVKLEYIQLCLVEYKIKLMLKGTTINIFVNN